VSRRALLGYFDRASPQGVFFLLASAFLRMLEIRKGRAREAFETVRGCRYVGVFDAAPKYPGRDRILLDRKPSEKRKEWTGDGRALAIRVCKRNTGQR
jgi:hypothetical protein